MELKLLKGRVTPALLDRLNRTFYGIETIEREFQKWNHAGVLIVPFMELKRYCENIVDHPDQGLNRTFYGIETTFGIIFAIYRSTS